MFSNPEIPKKTSIYKAREIIVAERKPSRETLTPFLQKAENSDISPIVNNLRLIIQNCAERFDEENQVALHHVSSPAIESKPKIIKKIGSEEKHVSFILGATNNDQNSSIPESVIKALTAHAEFRDKNIKKK